MLPLVIAGWVNLFCARLFFRNNQTEFDCRLTREHGFRISKCLSVILFISGVLIRSRPGRSQAGVLSREKSISCSDNRLDFSKKFPNLLVSRSLTCHFCYGEFFSLLPEYLGHERDGATFLKRPCEAGEFSLIF